jgi:hypothetical protein
MTQNSYIRPKSLYTIILYIRVGIWVISCHDCYRPLSFDIRMSLSVYRAPILFYSVQGSNMFLFILKFSSMSDSSLHRSYWCRNPPTCRKSLTNYITTCCIEYTSPCGGFELTTPVMVIGTDCTGSCKSNYHMITTTTARNINIFYRIKHIPIMLYLTKV